MLPRRLTLRLPPVAWRNRVSCTHSGACTVLVRGVGLTITICRRCGHRWTVVL